MVKSEITDDAETRETVEARQGDRRRTNLRVLLISFVLVVAVFALVYAIMFRAPA